MGVSPRRSGRSAAAPTTTPSNPSPPSPRRRRNSLQSHNHSPPPIPIHVQPSLTSPPPDDEEEDDDDASAEITRCVCGSQEYPFPDAEIEDTGFMICCERCNVWQHGPCVGVMRENEAPDIYYCEECRPDLHELGNRNQGHRQSRWIGSSIPHQPSRRKKSSASAHPQGSSLKGESLSPDPSDKDTTTSNNPKERKPSPKKRSTMNSRDAAYDYSSLFPAPTSITGGDDDSRMEDVNSPPASRAGDSRSRRRGKRVADDDDDDTTSLSRSSKRRRESNETEDQMDLDSRRSKKSAKRNSNDSDGKDDSSSDHQQHQGSTTPLLLDVSLPRSNNNGNNNKRSNQSKRKPPATSAKPESVDSEDPPTTPTFRRVVDDFMKPARARIPQSRSGLNEMRKRVGAILEYVGRLQADVTPGSETPNGMLLEDSETFEKPDLDNAPSMIIMQYLTKRCLDFELKFGKYPGRYG